MPAEGIDYTALDTPHDVFTGSYDDNGQEIYINDILSITKSLYNAKKWTYLKHVTCPVFTNGYWQSDDLQLTYKSLEKIIVVGNIWQNKDILDNLEE